MFKNKIISQLLTCIVLSLSSALGECPRQISDRGQESIDSAIVAELAKNGQVTLTDDGKMVTNRYGGTTYYLVNVSYCKYPRGASGCNEKIMSDPKTLKGRETLWDSQVSNMPGMIGAFTADVAHMANPARKRLMDDPVGGYQLGYDGFESVDRNDEHAVCYYHYRPSGAPNEDNLKIQIGVSKVEPNQYRQLYQTFLKRWGVQQNAPEIKGKGHFISLQTTDIIMAKKKAGGARINANMKCPFRTDDRLNYNNSRYLNNDVYTALANTGKVRLTDDGFIDNVNGKEYYLRYVLRCKDRGDGSQCNENGGYSLKDNPDSAKKILSQNPITGLYFTYVEPSTGANSDLARLGFVGGTIFSLPSERDGISNPIDVCVYRFNDGMKPAYPDYFPMQIGISTEDPENK